MSDETEQIKTILAKNGVSVEVYPVGEYIRVEKPATKTMYVMYASLFNDDPPNVKAAKIELEIRRMWREGLAGKHDTEPYGGFEMSSEITACIKMLGEKRALQALVSAL